jgi:diguanylate cyclase (GGDEF)-like protein
MLNPACERCGGVLRPVAAEDLERARAEDADQSAPRRRGGDAGAALALLLTLPWLLPLLGVQVGDFAFAVPLGLLCFATARLLARAGNDPRGRAIWLTLAIGTALPAVGSAVAVFSDILGDGVSLVAFYLGAGGTASMVVASALLLRAGRGLIRWERLVDAGLLTLVLAAVGVYVLVIPGIAHGDPGLTAVVAGDLSALVLFSLGAVGLRARAGRTGPWWLTVCAACTVVGDGALSASATGQIGDVTVVTALSWALAAYALAVAAEHPLPLDPAPRRRDSNRRWVVGRVLLPLSAVLAFPAFAGAFALAGELPAWALAYFSVFFVLALVLAFGRQAWLIADHGRAMVRERALRREATRRSEELEALTGLATTMTQTLEEEPIIEQALGVLQTAARATSAALHLGDRLAAAGGAWHAEREWAGRLPADELSMDERGGRFALRLPLNGRHETLGSVTLVRPATDPFDAHGVRLLQLLVAELGMAVQNARDYRERLEQAVRDPLTGLYNRRYLVEALEHEVSRATRYDSEATLVIFDIDDFKLINDRHGHTCGDEVLRQLAATVLPLIRPSDSLARIGGEEFALLLPETGQLEGLLVAERIRAAIAREITLPERRVTISAGVASCPGDATTAAELQRRADVALYWAKSNGKDLCAVAGEAVGSVDAETRRTEGILTHLFAVVAMIDAEHLHTRDHSETVAAYALAIGEALGLEREHLVRLRRAALLHDVGKVAVDSAILAKPSGLTDEEFEQIRGHSPAGGRMLAHAGLVEEAAWVRHHHERLLFVADAFEAMTSDRPYRAGMDGAEALAELRRCAGEQFDPEVVEVFARLLDSGRVPVLARRGAR